MNSLGNGRCPAKRTIKSFSYLFDVTKTLFRHADPSASPVKKMSMKNFVVMLANVSNTFFQNVIMRDPFGGDGAQCAPYRNSQEHKEDRSYRTVLVSKVNNLGVNRC